MDNKSSQQHQTSHEGVCISDVVSAASLLTVDIRSRFISDRRRPKARRGGSFIATRHGISPTRQRSVAAALSSSAAAAARKKVPCEPRSCRDRRRAVLQDVRPSAGHTTPRRPTSAHLAKTSPKPRHISRKLLHVADQFRRRNQYHVYLAVTNCSETTRVQRINYSLSCRDTKYCILTSGNI